MIAAFPRVDTPPPTSRFRLFFYDLISKRWFDYVVMLIVAANTALMCFNTNENYQGNRLSYWSTSNPQAVGDVIFTVFYTLEYIIRIIAIGPKHFFWDGWNNLDGLALLTTFIGWIFANEEAGRLLRLVKVFRLFKITKLIKQLRVLFKTITYVELDIFFFFFQI